ncbi:hypothetical protein [Deinococcus cellulosilyticus]|uniref:NHL repeat-containing protein n=1 Tax=Deinococcus cellulosilyticus (strain DSM 18568 / NBRC 106333 / KACC 11606 / 5516J-15) TaxID=1223518 RepID=A0A511MYR1_DEIC1|nr:hypothetical protein [Deinococcus cellulosilyticus]GEM45740.1 hypothetical protein DC3_13750 [Deinococcus cellulosilyticus NBRC 106333 = KACC 11606]
MRRWLVFAALSAGLFFSCNPSNPVPIPQVSTFAGSGTEGTADGKGAAAQFHNPVNLAFDDAGNLYVADFHDDNPGRIRKITPDGTVSTLFTDPTFSRPFGIDYHMGFLYVSTDRDSTGQPRSSLWKIDVSNGNHTIPVDNINEGRERGLVVAADGRIYLSDRTNNVIMRIDLSGANPEVVQLAGLRGPGAYQDGTGDGANFNTPYGLAVLGSDVLVADSGNNCVRRVTPAGVVTTFAGVCGPGGYKDGNLSEALFKGLQDLAVDGAGNVYVSDNGNHRIRKISGGKVSTIAGSGTAGFKDGPLLEAQFYGQEGIDVKPGGSALFVADGNGGNEPQPYRRIRQVPLP